MRAAEIFYNGEFAGILTEISRTKYCFQYEDAWFLNNGKPAISLTFPKNRQEYCNDSLFPFFFNMLSEGSNRKLQCRLMKIDENDFFGLLIATAGYDTIGAVTVKPLPADETE